MDGENNIVKFFKVWFSQPGFFCSKLTIKMLFRGKIQKLGGIPFLVGGYMPRFGGILPQIGGTPS